MKHLRLFSLIAALFLISSSMEAQSTKSLLTNVMEEFCQQQYKNIFGQQYQPSSLVITSVEIIESSDSYFVKGTHS